MHIDVFRLNNGQGWDLHLKRFSDPQTLVPGRRPVLMIPGYAMNTFILSFHPGGPSMVEHLVARGFEVWTANLRGQGDARRRWPGVEDHGFKELALVDLPQVRDFVLTESLLEPDALDLVGCSLGATVIYAYLAHHPREHHVGSVISIGGPLRWTHSHPLVRLVLASPGLAGAVPVRGTRRMARLALPLARRFPGLLQLYLNPEIIDLDAADELIKTIDDPSRRLTRQIAHWLKARDLVVDGLNVSDALDQVDVPLMCVLANQDGIVPPPAALSVFDHIASRQIEVVRVGDARYPHAHADLFISHGAREAVFEPMAAWLQGRYESAPPTQPADTEHSNA
ncbi:hypothetical protein DL240_19115 [Lujinxingia litoralis]|uniref:AB hydrolase-1 domain-containing protein n=1 Tax=Lujinxingia litoralis TaxID=2211119 RepID=A0A328C0B4_9DELT|nr:alpha/beta fold hydrolase [Lujinxingia litoralis]RAL20018.1 hypothetical protein DL240_19115 [Lujinxingia litoralis]